MCGSSDYPFPAARFAHEPQSGDAAVPSFDLLAVVAADQQQRNVSFLMRTAEPHPAVAELPQTNLEVIFDTDRGQAEFTR